MPSVRSKARPLGFGGRLLRSARSVIGVLGWPLRVWGFGMFLTLCVSVLGLVALVHVWTRLEIIRMGYALSSEARINQALVQHGQRLRLELATRKDPATVERVARERLRMAAPDPAAIRVIAAPSPTGSPP